APEDGVIQMAVSPWNAGRVVLVASGQNDAAVIKAAQALSTGALRGGEQPDRAQVAAIQPETSAATSSVDRSFADLGYDVQQMFGQGAQYAAYQFDLPAAQVITDEAYLDLAFVHTALLDYDQSGMTITLNDQPVASVRLDDTSTRLSSTRVALPSSALRAGSNTLVMRGDLLPRAVCTDPRGNGLWLAIRPESSLHLPLGSTPDSPAQALDLKRYPQPLTIDPSLQRLAFVLAADDPQSWAVAAGIALDLGRQTQLTLAEPLVVFGDSVPEQVRSSRDLVIVGRASRLPILDEIKESLPAPFAPGSDLAAEPGSPVQFRRSSGDSVGYVQLLAAPWDEQHAVLAVLGSTEQGLDWAGAAVTTPKLRSLLSGNLAIVHDQQITSTDTRPEQTPAEQPAETEAESAAAPAPSRAILLAAAAIGGLLLALIVALVIWWRRRKARRSFPVNETT
ncbi:MAG: cellulose biosynthesis cyclic di-GMP-binding regulatory protein BcsB, partial [Chloroflexi bacterium]|nr:cellulose biosynthesis cyclic di-GMP-binding regulatory protein BcsB [Chloroflexota bacterium]